MKRAAVLVFACVCLPACSRTLPQSQAPNVILISIDTLRADSLRVYNRAARPHPTLDALARRGRWFDRAYSAAPWTLPSHVSLFTGLYPDRHGVVDPRYAMGDVSSFVEKLRARGYQTVGFTDGGYLGAQYGFTRGFEVYDGWRDSDSAAPIPALPRGGKRNFDTKAGLFDRARALLQGRHDTRPLFLFVHTYAVHDYFRSWLPSKPGHTPRATPESAHELTCLVGTAKCAPEEWHALEAKYEAGIDVLDEALGSLLDVLDEKLDMDNTYVFVLSDHGEGFDYRRSRIHHGGRLHRDLLQVPLFVTGPGVRRGHSEEPVSLVDVAPSVLELVGLGASGAELDGRSLVPQLRGGKAQGKRGAVRAAEYYYYWKAGQRRKADKPSPEPLLSASIDSRYWYVESSSGNELYDANDRAQASPLADLPEKHPKWNRPHGAAAAKPAAVKDTVEVYKQLRALGYIQ